MKRSEGENLDREPLAYRLRQQVWHSARGGRPILILRFPLKTMILHHVWRPLFERLTTADFVTLEGLSSLVEQVPPEKVERFLNGLVRKGFLKRRGLSPLSESPFVSVVIAVRNRPKEIATCLESMERLDYPKERVETIVVDDASEDNTPDVVSRFPVRLIRLREQRQASFCRNLASEKAKGDILAFTDSDCLADPLWLRALVPCFQDPSVGAVGGRVDSLLDEIGLDHYEKVKSSLSMGHWFMSSRAGGPFFYVPSCNLLVRRDLFRKLDGFRECLHVGEDVDLCWRLRDGGCHVEYWPVGKIYHRHRNKMIPFCWRRFDYGTSESILQRLHTRRVKTLFMPPAASLFWTLIVLSVVLKSASVLLASGIVLVIDSLVKLRRIHHRGLPVKSTWLVVGVCRGYVIFFYHLCAFVSRYYLLWSIVIFPFIPMASATILGMHLVTAFAEFFIKKPHLDPASFLFYFSLEQLSYQAGVWWGCFRYLYFRPVNPQIVTEQASRADS